MAQIGSATGIPIVHTVELLDWASGGPMPAALAGSPQGHRPELLDVGLRGDRLRRREQDHQLNQRS
jgi:glycolate oxidase iron-sulfur subunit